MSKEGSDEWVSDSGDSGPAEEPVTDEKQASGPFPRRSLEEVERDAATTRRRTSSLSSGLAALSPSEHAASQPAQPAPSTPPHGSAFPNQIPHDALHDRTRSPKTTLPDYHDPDSPTQKRGPGIARNPVSDTWRADAYEKREAGKEKIVDVAKKQDRWKCEYCGNLNDRGVSGFVAAPGEEEGVGMAGSSRASPNTTRTPIQILTPAPPGLAPGEQVKCRYCAEQIFAEHPRYDPREMSEDGMHWDEVDAPEEVKAKMRKTVGRAAQRRVLERWKEDEWRKEEEEEREKGKGKGKETKKEEGD